MEDEDNQVGAVAYSSDVDLDTIRYKAGQGKYENSNASQSGVKFANYGSDSGEFTEVEEVE